MTTDRVRRAQAATGERPRKHKVGPPTFWLAVIALASALAPADVPMPFDSWNVGVAGQGLPTVSIGDATVVEGNSGVNTLSFPVTLSGPSAQEVRVGYGTVGGVDRGTATGGLTQVVRQSAGVLTTIPDVGPASNYPITINVSGVTGVLEQIDVALNGLTHTNPSDIDVLLEAPSGETMVILSDAGGSTAAAKAVVTLKDDASAAVPSPLVSGVFWPYSGPPADNFPAPAPAGPYTEAGPAGPGTLNDLYRGITPNGTWKIWIADDTPGNQGSIGNIALTFGVADPTADFVPRFGQLVFPPGTTSKTIDVKVNGDLSAEANETIIQDLFASIGSQLGRARATGTILDDDGGPGGLPPTTVNDAYQTVRDTPLQVTAPGVLANDMTNLGGSLSAEIVANPSFGLLTLASDGSFKYIPGPNFVGTDTFTYRARNAAGDGNVATVAITVTGALARNDSFLKVIIEDSIVTGDVLANDDSGGAGPLTAELVSPPSSGTLTLNPNGSFRFEAGSIGTYTFTYRARAADGSVSNIATVTIELADVPRLAPTNLRVDNIDRSSGANRVTVRFDPPTQGPAPTQYVLKGGIQSGHTLATLLSDSRYPIIEFDAPFGDFWLSAAGVIGSGLTGDSNEVRLNTTTLGAPSAPENLLIAVNGSRLDLAWKNTYRGGITTNVILDVTGDATGSLPLGPVETFSFDGVPPLDLNFSVRSVNAAGSSANSNQVSGSFPGTCTPPLTPENFLVYVNGPVLGAIWDLPSSGTAPMGYTLDVASAVYTGTVKVPRLTNLRANVTSGTYALRVSADHEKCGSSGYTPWQTVVKP